MLQCVAVCCILRGFQCCAQVNIGEYCVAVCCSMLQWAAVCCSVLQCVAVCYSALRCAAVSCSVLPYIYTHITTHTSTHIHGVIMMLRHFTHW